MKPIRLCARGSGSTLMTAEQTGHRCYMIELDPVYCDVIVVGWEAMTKQKGVKLESYSYSLELSSCHIWKP